MASAFCHRTLRLVRIGNNCKTKGGEGPGWQGGWSELFSRVNAWESMLLQTLGVMGELGPAVMKAGQQ